MKRVILLSDTDQASSDVRFDYLSPEDWQRLNEHDCISDKYTNSVFLFYFIELYVGEIKGKSVL